jgi:hypothetical protein
LTRTPIRSSPTPDRTYVREADSEITCRGDADVAADSTAHDPRGSSPSRVLSRASASRTRCSHRRPHRRDGLPPSGCRR